MRPCTSLFYALAYCYDAQLNTQHFPCQRQHSAVQQLTRSFWYHKMEILMGTCYADHQWEGQSTGEGSC